MEKRQITLAQVYRINGRLVVANSREDAINIWREWMSQNCPAIKSIKRIGNDPTLHIGNEALVFKEGLYDDNVSQFLDNIDRRCKVTIRVKNEEIDKCKDIRDFYALVRKKLMARF